MEERKRGKGDTPFTVDSRERGRPFSLRGEYIAILSEFIRERSGRSPR